MIRLSIYLFTYFYLSGIKDGPYSPNTPVDKKVEWVEKKKKQGNSLYSTKKFKLSLRAYGNCITVLKEGNDFSFIFHHNKYSFI